MEICAVEYFYLFACLFFFDFILRWIVPSIHSGSWRYNPQPFFMLLYIFLFVFMFMAQTEYQCLVCLTLSAFSVFRFDCVIQLITSHRPEKKQTPFFLFHNSRIFYCRWPTPTAADRLLWRYGLVHFEFVCIARINYDWRVIVVLIIGWQRSAIRLFWPLFVGYFFTHFSFFLSSCIVYSTLRSIRNPTLPRFRWSIFFFPPLLPLFRFSYRLYWYCVTGRCVCVYPPVC